MASGFISETYIGQKKQDTWLFVIAFDHHVERKLLPIFCTKETQSSKTRSRFSQMVINYVSGQ